MNYFIHIIYNHFMDIEIISIIWKAWYFYNFFSFSQKLSLTHCSHSLSLYGLGNTVVFSRWLFFFSLSLKIKSHLLPFFSRCSNCCAYCLKRQLEAFMIQYLNSEMGWCKRDESWKKLNNRHSVQHSVGLRCPAELGEIRRHSKCCDTESVKIRETNNR